MEIKIPYTPRNVTEDEQKMLTSGISALHAAHVTFGEVGDPPRRGAAVIVALADPSKPMSHSDWIGVIELLKDVLADVVREAMLTTLAEAILTSQGRRN